MRDNDLDIERLRNDLIEEDVRVLGAVVRAAACAHQDRRAASLREREELLHAREMGRIAQADPGIAEVELDSGHARESEHRSSSSSATGHSGLALQKPMRRGAFRATSAEAQSLSSRVTRSGSVNALRSSPKL